jgi:DNA-binding NarL/FixJ family response regulator
MGCGRFAPAGSTSAQLPGTTLTRRPPKDNLTQREMEVLNAVSRGMSNNMIAERLGISPKTVDNHRTNLMRKLKVHSTATLLVRAIRDRIIDV